MRRSLGLALLATASLVAVGCTTASTTVTGEGSGSSPLRVLAAFNVTGGMNWIDVPALNGFLLAAEQLNAAGGIAGRRIEVVVIDGATDEHVMSQRVAQELERGDILAIGGLNDGIYALAPRRGAVRPAAGGLVSFGHSSIAIALGRVGAQAAVPIVAIGSSLPDLPGRVGEHFFGLAAATDRKVSAIATYAENAWGAQRAVLLWQEDHDFTGALASLFTQEWLARDGEIILDVSYSPGMLDLPAAVSRLQALDPAPDVIFLAGLPNDAGIILEQVRRAGLDQPVLSADWFDTPFIAPYAGDRGDDLYFSADLVLGQPGEELRTFQEAYEAEYGEAPRHGFAAMGYDAMRLIAAAMARADMMEPEAVGDALAMLESFPALQGDISYGAGQTRPTGPVAIVRTEDGRFSFVTRVEISAG